VSGDPRRSGRPPHGSGPGWWPRPVAADDGGWLPRSGASSPEDAGLADDLAVRPFLLTGGRTRPGRDDLRVESLIQALPGIATGSLRFEGRRIYDLCQQPASIADVAAAVGVPLGVTRVLVSDLIAGGHVALVQSQAISVQLLERIRDRVRAL
jgi:hypothetical protein